MKVVLVMFKDDERRDFPLRGKGVVIGRAVECGLRIPLQDVSRRHCEIAIGTTETRIKDLGSANGTYVNGRRIAESALAPGDVVEIGPVRFLAQIEGKPAAVTPHDLKVQRVDEPSVAKTPPAGKADTRTPATRVASGSAKPAPVKAAPSKPTAPAPKPAPSTPAKTPVAGKPASAEEAPMELTEDDLFDIGDVEFDLSEGSWADDEDDETDVKPKGKK